MTNNKTFNIDSNKNNLFSGSYNTIWINNKSSQDVNYKNQKEIEEKYGKPIKLNLLKHEVKQ